MKNEIIRVGQIGIRFLLEAADANGSVAMFEIHRAGGRENAAAAFAQGLRRDHLRS